nr:MAG TPA: hypothetical protein [Caudoviricetes sp.]
MALACKLRASVWALESVSGAWLPKTYTQTRRSWSSTTNR